MLSSDRGRTMIFAFVAIRVLLAVTAFCSVTLT